MRTTLPICKRQPSDDEATDKAGSNTTSARTSSVSSSRPSHLQRGSTTSSGFASDVITGAPRPMSAALVPHHDRTRELNRLYDSTEAWELGRGGCGAVRTVRKRSTGETYAMKTVKLDDLDSITLGELRAEIEIQRSLDHPHIVKIIESFEDQERRRIHIVMELCTGGSLVSRLNTRKAYGERAAAAIVEKMLGAVFYCHKHGFVHRDLKLDNFIYETEAEDAELKLIDFGFAFEVQPGSKDEMFERLGTLSYMAPELLSKDKKRAYDSSVDMWAMGVVTYMVLCGRRPFHHEDRQVKKRMICNDPVTFEGREWSRVSPQAKDFCLQLMQKDPAKRLAASDALKHEWIRKNGSFSKRGSKAASPTADPLVESAIVENLSSYSRATELKRLALEAIAFATPPQKLEELRRLFGEIDADGSGTLSLEEFRRAMASQLPEKKVDRIFRAMDLSRAGEVDYSEFLSAALNQRRNLASPSIAGAFSLLDTDHDGFITTCDLNKLLGETLSREEVDSMLASPTVGARGGKLAYDDFKFLMLKGDKGVARKVHKQVRAHRWKSEPSALDRHVAATLPVEVLALKRSSEMPPGGFDETSTDEDSVANWDSPPLLSTSVCSSASAAAEKAAPEVAEMAAASMAAAEKAAASMAAAEKAAAEQTAYCSTLEAARKSSLEREHAAVEKATVEVEAADDEPPAKMLLVRDKQANVSDVSAVRASCPARIARRPHSIAEAVLALLPRVLKPSTQRKAWSWRAARAAATEAAAGCSPRRASRDCGRRSQGDASVGYGRAVRARGAAGQQPSRRV